MLATIIMVVDTDSSNTPLRLVHRLLNTAMRGIIMTTTVSRMELRSRRMRMLSRGGYRGGWMGVRVGCTDEYYEIGWKWERNGVGFDNV